MKLTIVGSGDAFGSGGRCNTCFFLETAKSTLLVDCGASALPALKGSALDPNRIDAIILSHLHGDHFGALPFLLLDAQFLSRRERALLIAWSARNARTHRCGSGSVLSKVEWLEVALSLARGGNCAGRRGRRARTYASDR